MNVKIFIKAITDIIRKGSDSDYKLHFRNGIKRIDILYKQHALYSYYNESEINVNNPEVLTTVNIPKIIDGITDLVQVEYNGQDQYDNTIFNSSSIQNEIIIDTKTIKNLDKKILGYYYYYSVSRCMLFIYTDDTQTLDKLVAVIMAKRKK